MNFRKLTGWLLGAILLVLHPQPAHPEEVVVAVATNFLLPARQVSAQFEAASGHEVTLVAGATGKLAAQILAGAPFDVFLAADRTRPQLLVDRGAALADSGFTYAIGTLVLWSRQALPGAADISGILEETRIKRLAVANPRLAPYGKAAEQSLDKLGLLKTLEGRIVFGENIGQAFAIVASGNATAGFIAKSQLVSLPEGDKGHWVEVPAGLHEPIRQDAVMTMRGRTNKAAVDFVSFLRSDAARGVIERNGYEVPQP